MLKIYGVYRSRASRPLWLVEELGLPFEHVPIIQAYRLNEPMAKGSPANTLSAEFLAVNPMGSIPSMDMTGSCCMNRLPSRSISPVNMAARSVRRRSRKRR